MPFTPETFLQDGQRGGRTAWHYQTKDSYAEVVKRGYFDVAAYNIKIGSVVLIEFQTPEGQPHALLECWFRQVKPAEMSAINLYVPQHLDTASDAAKPRGGDRRRRATSPSAA